MQYVGERYLCIYNDNTYRKILDEDHPIPLRIRNSRLIIKKKLITHIEYNQNVFDVTLGVTLCASKVMGINIKLMCPLKRSYK